MKTIYVAMCNCREDVYADEMPTEDQPCVCGVWHAPSRFKKEEIAEVISETLPTPLPNKGGESKEE